MGVMCYSLEHARWMAVNSKSGRGMCFWTPISLSNRDVWRDDIKWVRHSASPSRSAVTEDGSGGRRFVWISRIGTVHEQHVETETAAGSTSSGTDGSGQSDMKKEKGG